MKYAAAEKGEREVRRYRVTQITAAQLGTFALYDAGALVLQSGGLIPADSLGGFRGVRFGDFVSGILDESRFDDPSREIETSSKHAPDEQA